MTGTGTGTLLRPAAPDELAGGLAAALDGGPPVAPLPSDAVERRRALTALRLDEPADPDAAVVVLSSGSTGEPKGVVLTAAAVRASAEATHARLGGPGHWLLALPPHHIAGLMVLSRAHLAGTAVVSLRRDLGDLAGARLPTGRRYLSVVPPSWSAPSNARPSSMRSPASTRSWSAVGRRPPGSSPGRGRRASPARRRTG